MVRYNNKRPNLALPPLDNWPVLVRKYDVYFQMNKGAIAISLSVSQ